MPRGPRDRVMMRRRAAESAATTTASETTKTIPAILNTAKPTPTQYAIIPGFELRRRADDKAEDEACPVKCGNTAICCPEGHTCLFKGDGSPVCQNSAIAGLNDFINEHQTIPTTTAAFNHLSYLSSAKPSLQPSYYSSVLSSLEANPTSRPPEHEFTGDVDAHAAIPDDSGPSFSAIAGGAIGGTVGIAVIVLGVWMSMRHRKTKAKNSTLGSSRATGNLSMPGIEGGTGYKPPLDTQKGWSGAGAGGAVKGQEGWEMERPLPPPPPVELGAGRRSQVAVEMEGDMMFQRRTSVVNGGPIIDPHVWHELEAGPVGR